MRYFYSKIKIVAFQYSLFSLFPLSNQTLSTTLRSTFLQFKILSIFSIFSSLSSLETEEIQNYIRFSFVYLFHPTCFKNIIKGKNKSIFIFSPHQPQSYKLKYKEITRDISLNCRLVSQFLQGRLRRNDARTPK